MFTTFSQILNGGDSEPILKPKLLPGNYDAALRIKLVYKLINLRTGELEVTSAENVQLYPSPNKSPRDLVCTGLLVVTNFKLSFISTDTTEVSHICHSTYICHNNAARYTNL